MFRPSLGINHQISVANVLVTEGGITDPTVLCSAILHDTLSDTETTIEELGREFGPSVAAIVLEVTDDKALGIAEQKRRPVFQTPRLSLGARLVRLADEICNVRDLLEAPPESWSVAARCEYFEWAASFVESIRGSSPVLEQVFDSIPRRPFARERLGR